MTTPRWGASAPPVLHAVERWNAPAKAIPEICLCCGNLIEDPDGTELCNTCTNDGCNP